MKNIYYLLPHSSQGQANLWHLGELVKLYLSL